MKTAYLVAYNAVQALGWALCGAQLYSAYNKAAAVNGVSYKDLKYSDIYNAASYTACECIPVQWRSS